MVMIQTAESSHWYRRDGTPCYGVECKSKPGEMRNTTLADARKMGLVPSVTTIDKMVANKGLERWKQEQLLLSALTTSRIMVRDNGIDRLEYDCEFVSRIVEDATAYTKQAADLGTEIHAAVEAYLSAAEYDNRHDAYVRSFRGAWEEFCEKNRVVMYWCEVPFACPLGFGGRIDLDVMCDDSIWRIDLKTGKTAPGKKFSGYRSWLRQLAAYAYGTNGADAKVANIVLSTSEPGRVEFIDWTEERDQGWLEFQAAFTLWKGENKFDPSWKGQD